jgi:CheY-like chemotaxis protein
VLEAAIVRVKDGEQDMRYLFQRGLFTEEPKTPHLVVLAAELPVVSTDAIVDRLRQHPRTESIP